MPWVRHASDRALLVSFEDGAARSAGAAVRALSAWLRREPPSALVDLHPAYATLLVTYDPLRCDPDALAAEIAARSDRVEDLPTPAPRWVVVPVRYGGADGPDLEDVARSTGLTRDDVVAAHAGATYQVEFIGFSPGFPYLSGLPERLRTPRRASPRRSVAAGSVAIAGDQAGIYPLRSPGGWNVIGRTEMILFDPADGDGAALAPGDRVRFQPVGIGG